MSIPNVSIELANGQLGRVNDIGNGYPGLIVVGLTAGIDHPLDAAKLYASVEKVEEVFDFSGKDSLKEAIQNYFLESLGKPVYLMPVAAYAGATPADYKAYFSTKLQAMQNGSSDRVRFVGLVGMILDGNPAISEAMLAGQSAAEELVKDYKPVSIYFSVKYASDLDDLTEATYNRCGALIDDSGVYLGLLMGRLARIPVQRNIGRVKDGSVSVLDAKIGVEPVESSLATVTVVYGKKYICLRTYPGKAGYYFTDDPLAAPATDDYSQISLRRVIDKVIMVAYGVYVEQVNDEILISSDGTIPPAVVKDLQGLIENAINKQMTNNGEISSVSAFIDHQQDVVGTGKLEIAVGIVPVGYTKEIIVKLGFENPNTSK